MRKHRLVFFQIMLLLFFSACSTIPRNTAQRDTGDFSLLPSGGQLYLWADINESRVLLDNVSFEGMQLNQASAILDRTNTATAVFFGKAETEDAANQGAVYFLNLRGSFPSFQAGFSFTFSRDWKRNQSITGNSFWQSQGMRISLAMNSNLALVSAGDPFLMLPANSRIPAVRVPDGFDEFRQGSVVSGWIPDNELVNKFLSDLSLPIQIPAEAFFFKAKKPDAFGESLQGGAELTDLWELEFLIRTPTANQSQGLLMLFSIARPFIMSFSVSSEKQSLMDFIPALFANQPSRDGADLMLKSASFTTGELALLFNIISVYSNQQ